MSLTSFRPSARHSDSILTGRLKGGFYLHDCNCDYTKSVHARMPAGEGQNGQESGGGGGVDKSGVGGGGGAAAGSSSSHAAGGSASSSAGGTQRSRTACVNCE